VFHIEGEVGQQEQRDDARPVVERDRYSGEPHRIDPRGDDADDHAVQRGLGDEAPDCDEGRDAGVLPRVAAVARLDHQRFGEDREGEDRQEHEDDRVRRLAEELGKAEVELHCVSSRIVSATRGAVCSTTAAGESAPT